MAALALWGALTPGCGRSKVEEALDSDANGYQCLNCREKFYTERDLFANVCPGCKQANIQPVVGFVCAADGHVTLAVRGRGFLPCAKCGQPTSRLSIPRESDLQAWGAARRSSQEVGGY